MGLSAVPFHHIMPAVIGDPPRQDFGIVRFGQWMARVRHAYMILVSHLDALQARPWSENIQTLDEQNGSGNRDGEFGPECGHDVAEDSQR